MDGNQIAAHFIRTTSWEKLPAEVCQKAKTGLLDNLGCMIAGSQARISRVCRDYMDTVWPQGDEASIVMQGCKSSLFGAAFVNANTANATDMDDDGLYCDGHPGAQLVPVTLALAEKYCLSGKELLSALVVGYEVAHRVGACWHDDHEMKRLGGRQPRTEEEAQFNVAWPLAVYLQYGEISPHHMLEKNLSDKKLIA